MAGKGLELLAPVGRAGGGMLRQMLDIAIEGLPWLPGARKAAGRQLEKQGDVEAAIDVVVRHHLALATAQGFATNLGGFAALPATIPANLAGVAMVQLRMVACIAHLRGYNLDDARVRSAIMMCLISNGMLTNFGAGLPGSPLVVATAPVFNASLDQKISEKVLACLAAQVGGTQVTTMVARRIPIIGGGIGAASDGWATWQLSSYVRQILVDRRPKH